MRKMIIKLLTVLFIATFINSTASAANSMEGYDMDTKDKFGELIHESKVDGYMLSYYFMDLRNQNSGDHDKTEKNQSHDTGTKDMDKPHHLMVYIMDKNHKPVVKGKVGFLIKGENNVSQKAMGMVMSDGFGTTADMKKKGTYKITTKAVLGKKKLMDSFNYEIK